MLYISLFDGSSSRLHSIPPDQLDSVTAAYTAVTPSDTVSCALTERLHDSTQAVGVQESNTYKHALTHKHTTFSQMQIDASSHTSFNLQSR